MQDPETYLLAREIPVQSYFDDTRPAILDPEHRVRVNYELYFFSEEAERERFLEDPLRHCGLVTDPVTHTRFRPDSDSPRIDHAGQPFFFESGMSRMIFASMPDSFIVPRFKMPEMRSDDDGER